MQTVPARRATTHALLALAAVVLAFLVTPAGPASAASTVKVRLRTAIKNLPVASETPTGYDRSKFKLWIDADGDCQDTRAEVLIAETKAATTGSCTIQTGRWFSYYDRVTWTQASDVDIDHPVPLKEAWDSGAKTWNADTRMRYANDLRDPRTLVAVTDNVNQAKGDRDPADWMPQYGKCRYVRQWTAVKIRWSLKVNRAEKTKLANVASHCTNVTLTVTKSTIGKGAITTTSGGTTSGSPDPRFDYCYQATAAGYGPYYQSKDAEYAWYTDSDHDGIVCE
jgi:hypothetical protein